MNELKAIIQQFEDGAITEIEFWAKVVTLGVDKYAALEANSELELPPPYKGAE